MLLKDILNAKTTSIILLNASRRGGTYIRATMHKVHVSPNPKKEWGCVWSKVHDVVNDYDIPWDANPTDYRGVELIFKENPFDFLRNKLHHPIKAEYSYLEGQLMVQDGVFFAGYSFHTNIRPAQPTPEAKSEFLQFLLYRSNLDITRKNVQFIDTCRASNDSVLQEAAANFHAHTDLWKFYEERVGNILNIHELPMTRLYLTEHEVKTKDFSVVRFDMPATDEQKNALMAHFNG